MCSAGISKQICLPGGEQTILNSPSSLKEYVLPKQNIMQDKNKTHSAPFKYFTFELFISDNYSKFELPIAEGVNKIYISIDIDEVLFLAYLLSLFPILDSQAIGNKSQTP